MKKQSAKELLIKYRNNTCTDEERAQVEAWYAGWNDGVPGDLSEERLELAVNRVFEQLPKTGRKAYFPGSWSRVAAALILIPISVSIYFYYNDYAYTDKGAPVPGQIHYAADIAPGYNKASLTLADGRKISLTDAKDGELLEQSGVKITKAADGQLIYTISGSDDRSREISYNTIETPLGGQYQVSLPDGSQVWLNSASSLRYPVRFTGKERNVEITGEAYFEIAPDKSMPFRVRSAGQTVEVLGTHFNIMAYNDEKSTNTTLLEGSVKIIKEDKSMIISPGQQARVKDNNIDVVNADLQEVTAWKNGYFIFKNEDIQSIMRKISRWYDVEVEYRGNVLGKAFGGKISRSRNVSEVLKILGSTGLINFKIIPGDSQGGERRIIVMP